MQRKKTSTLMPSTLAIALIAGPALAMGDLPPRHPHPHDRDQPVAAAPEIDAGSGLASAAVVLAALCLAWERRRRSDCP